MVTSFFCLTLFFISVFSILPQLFIFISLSPCFFFIPTFSVFIYPIWSNFAFIVILSYPFFFFWRRPTSSRPNTVFCSVFSIPTPFFPLYTRRIHRRLLVMHIYYIRHIYSVESKSFFICLHTPLSTVTDNTNTYYLVCDLFMN